ncbi:MAG TPA: hypothetical protein VK081_00445 [Planctomycetota bacterium]|nr:hypothetical protein [Planctomycetota bacterium]
MDDKRTHRDLLPKDVCPSFVMKHILTASLDEVVFDERTHPGDGYAWCLKTCRDVGPDDELVRAQSCRPGRACFDGPEA